MEESVDVIKDYTNEVEIGKDCVVICGTVGITNENGAAFKTNIGLCAVFHKCLVIVICPCAIVDYMGLCAMCFTAALRNDCVLTGFAGGVFISCNANDTVGPAMIYDDGSFYDFQTVKVRNNFRIISCEIFFA